MRYLCYGFIAAALGFSTAVALAQTDPKGSSGAGTAPANPGAIKATPPSSGSDPDKTDASATAGDQSKPTGPGSGIAPTNPGATKAPSPGEPKNVEPK